MTNKPMTKSQLVAKLAESTGSDKASANRMIDTLSSIISEEQLEDLDIDVNSRAGNLSPDDYLKIAKARQ